MLQAASTRETRESARELKFLVPPAMAQQVLEWSRSRLAPDPYATGASGDEYRTTSLYFDTARLAVYHREGSFKRSKYRIRRYGSADVVFLERKLRTSTMLTKRRTTVGIEQLAWLNDPLTNATWAGYWFKQRIDARQLMPVCQVAYHRHARVGTGPFGPLRLTFDHDIQVQPCHGLEFAPPSGVPVLETHHIIEMKFRAVMPAVLKHLIEEFALEPAPISKYRLSMAALARTGVRTGTSEIDLGQIRAQAGVGGAISA